MKFSLKTTNLELTPDIYGHLEKTINSLDKFIENVDSVVQAWVEIGRISQHHRSGKIYRVEVQIRLPGKSVRSEAVAKTIFQAINEVKDKLQRELKQYKGKNSRTKKDLSKKKKQG
ncbi:ribosome hibernation-promoting factor, HPF/YfiA family [Patescibacteria group bacterium]